MYRVVTIAHTMMLNAVLTKKQICGTMNVSLLEFERLSAAGGGGTGLVAARHHGLGSFDDSVLVLPDIGLARELRFR